MGDVEGVLNRIRAFGRLTPDVIGLEKSLADDVPQPTLKVEGRSQQRIAISTHKLGSSFAAALAASSRRPP